MVGRLSMTEFCPFKTVKYKTREGAPSVRLETDEKWSLVTDMVKCSYAYQSYCFFLGFLLNYSPGDRIKFHLNSPTFKMCHHWSISSFFYMIDR